MTKLNCLYCGKDFDVTKRQLYLRKKFCSSKCQYDNRRKRVSTKCKICSKEFEVGIWKFGQNRGKTCSKECRHKWQSTLRGTKSGNWQGGEHLNSHGYVLVTLGDGSRRYKHVLIAEKALGRKLKKGEVVHHVNGNKADNRNCNLLICTQSYHQWLEGKMACLYKEEHFAHI